MNSEASNHRQLCLGGVFLGDEEGDGQEILHPHPQPHVGVRQIYLSEVYWPETQVGGDYLLQNSLKCTPEAHRLHGG